MAIFLRSPEVTIGIPAYNATAHLEKCLGSVAAQTFRTSGMEIILVDDGSTDGTAELARQLFRRLGLRGRVLSQPNTGSPAAARNTALDRARGRWIYFVDVDDYLGEQAITAMTSLGEQGEADVVVGRYVGVGRGAPKVMFERTLRCTDARQTPLIDSLNVLKMYRTEFARNIGYRFNPKLRMAEDHPFALAAYARTSRVAVQADIECYYWVRHTDAIGKSNHLTGHVLAVDEFYAYMHESFAVLRNAIHADHPRALYLRDRYWHRLLTFDIPNEMRRKRTPADREASITAARGLIDRERATESAGEFNAKSRAMLRSLEIGDWQMVEAVAALVR